MIKLLLDENLSPWACRQLRSEGFDVAHVLERSMLGAEDPEVLERAFAEDRILVTSNVKDFEKLARAREVHAGIVLVEHSGLMRDEQLGLLRDVVARLGEEADLVNRVLRVAEDGSMSIEDLSRPG